VTSSSGGMHMANITICQIGIGTCKLIGECGTHPRHCLKLPTVKSVAGMDVGSVPLLQIADLQIKNVI